MQWADRIIERLERGETVSFRPRGNSMRPKIKSGQLVTVSPDLSNINDGDVVLCTVKGRQYLHYVCGICDGRYAICNASGFPNGWASKIHGKLISTQDTRP